MSAPRVYFAMARDGLFIPAAASLHQRFGTPARAIALHALLASLLVALGSFNQIVSYFIFVVVIFVALTVSAVFVVRRKQLDKNAYQTPGYPITPIVFLLLVAVLLFCWPATVPNNHSWAWAWWLWAFRYTTCCSLAELLNQTTRKTDFL